jgi:hypothetical protein
MLTPFQVGEFLKTLHNPRYINPERAGAILFDGIFHGQLLPFFASPTDSMEYGRMIYAKAIEGAYGPIGEYVPEPEPQLIDSTAEETR